MSANSFTSALEVLLKEFLCFLREKEIVTEDSEQQNCEDVLVEQTEEFIEAGGVRGITQGLYLLLKFCSQVNLSGVTVDWEKQLLQVNAKDGCRYCIQISVSGEENVERSS